LSRKKHTVKMAYSEKQTNKAKELILCKISEGESLKSILEENEATPSRPIVYQWLNEDHKYFDKEFFNNYVRAREDSADLDAEKVQEIADKTLKGEYKPEAARVALDAYKWNAGKKKPKKYGNNMDITTLGEKITGGTVIIQSEGESPEITD